MRIFEDVAAAVGPLGSGPGSKLLDGDEPVEEVGVEVAVRYIFDKEDVTVGGLENIEDFGIRLARKTVPGEVAVSVEAVFQFDKPTLMFLKIFIHLNVQVL